MDAGELRELLEPLPRVQLCRTPSPLENWRRISEAWCPGSRLQVKRDDLIGPGYGGNKSRQLEFLLGDALNRGCDTIVHGGALQSNYCRQLAAACAELGLECHVVLSSAYSQPVGRGSHLLTLLFGANVQLFDGPLGARHEAAKRELADRLHVEGKHPYLITYPSSEVLGACGYIDAAAELTLQMASSADRPSSIFAAAVGATYAGLLLGLRLLGDEIPIVGISPLAGEYDILPTIRDAIIGTAEMLGVDVPAGTLDQITISEEWVGDGYGQPTQEGLAALHDVARSQGVLLDPVYTSKAMAAVRKQLAPGELTLFWHTGGAPAVFAFENALLLSRKDL